MKKNFFGISILAAIFLLACTGSLLVFLNQRHEKAVEDTQQAAAKALAEGRTGDAREHFEELLRLDRDNAEAAARLFDLNLFFKPEEARQYLAILSKAEDRPAGILYRKARMALHDKDIEAANAALEALEKIAPISMEALFARMMVDLEAKRYASVLPTSLKLMELYPHKREAQYLSAEIYRHSEDPGLLIRSKDLLLNLIRQDDEFGFKAAVLLSSANPFPAFAQDRNEAAEALLNHPFRDEGLALLEPGLLRGLAMASLPAHPRLAEAVTSALIALPEATPVDALLSDVSRLISSESPSREIFDKFMDAIEMRMEADPSDNISVSLLSLMGDNILPLLEQDAQVRLLRAITRQESVAPGPYLHAQNSLAKLLPEERSEIIDTTINRLKDTSPLPLARWLISINEPDRALELLPEASALKDIDFLLPRLEALAAVKKKDAVFALIEQSTPLEDWHKSIIRARYFIEQDDLAASQQELQNLLGGLPVDQPLIRFDVADLAKQLGDLDLQRKMYQEAFEDGLLFPNKHASTWLGMLLKDRDMDMALDFAAFCRSNSPDNPFYINNHIYLKILAGYWGSECTLQMQRIVDRFPEVPQFKLTFALSLIKGGQSGKALEVSKQISLDEFPEDHRSHMALAIIHAGAGDSEKAEELLQSVDLDHMLDAEIALVDRILRDGRF